METIKKVYIQRKEFLKKLRKEEAKGERVIAFPLKSKAYTLNASKGLNVEPYDIIREVERYAKL